MAVRVKKEATKRGCCGREGFSDRLMKKQQKPAMNGFKKKKKKKKKERVSTFSRVPREKKGG